MHDVQSAYYSGKQHTLHAALVQFPNVDWKYIFHLSDDTNHDSIMTDVNLNGIVSSYPELIKNGAIVLQSDNCSTQYKSRYVFHNMLRLAAELNVPIYWHGQGLIDAMGWFGCKGPLRKSIIEQDKWFPTWSMVEFLQTNFENDNTKY